MSPPEPVLNAVMPTRSRSKPQKRMRPVKASLSITQSPMNDHSGYLKVAGRFFSKTKWPIQAKP
ncbi:hypothetical protein D3C80_2049230 [compost metagenome]